MKPEMTFIQDLIKLVRPFSKHILEHVILLAVDEMNKINKIFQYFSYVKN